MSTTRTQELTITDESGDRALFSTVVDNDEGDFTNDDEYVLATVKVGDVRHVNISRADLAELKLFLEEIAQADAEEVLSDE